MLQAPPQSIAQIYWLYLTTMMVAVCQRGCQRCNGLVVVMDCVLNVRNAVCLTPMF